MQVQSFADVESKRNKANCKRAGYFMLGLALMAALGISTNWVLEWIDGDSEEL